MILKYTEYIKENIDNTTIHIVNDFIIKYLKEKNTNDYFIFHKIKDNDTRSVYYLEYVFGFALIEFKFGDKGFIINYLDDENLRYNNTDKDCQKALNDIKEYLDNFYTYFLKYLEKYDTDIQNIPIVDIDKYIEFIEYLCINFRDIESMSNYDSVIVNFKEYVYNDELLSNLRPKFDEKLGYLMNANNFDLI